MKKTALIAIITMAIISSCHKAPQSNSTDVSETQVLTDFVNKIALPQYQNLQLQATNLNTTVQTLSTNPTADNLNAARNAWKNTRAAWESCEGFLFGPVEDNNYDPNMDTWPVDYLQLDSLIAGSNSFSVGMVQALNTSLRGFHPLEFILWGQNGNATADSITTKQKQYMVSLSQDILNTVDSLNASWASNGGNFQQQVLKAGTGSTLYASKKEALLAIAASMADICNEVGEQATGGKIYDPFSSYDSTKTESPFSHNSITDFVNNISGSQNVYLCTYNGQSGASLSNLVAAKNLALDNKIKAQFTTAINAIQSVNVNFETAIFTQRTQLQNAMTALNTLQAMLDGDLKDFIQTNIKD
jgi:predicted lipoprotein